MGGETVVERKERKEEGGREREREREELGHYTIGPTDCRLD